MLDPHITGAGLAERILDAFLDEHGDPIDVATLEGLARAS